MIIKDSNSVTITPDFTASALPPEAISFDGYFSAQQVRHGEGSHHAGYIEDREMFSRSFGDPLYAGGLYIKDAGEVSHSLPRSYEQFAEAVQRIADFEAAHSRFFLYKRAMLTVRQDILEPGARLDGLPWHQDRGRKNTDKPVGPLVDHIYTVSDRFPTLLQQDKVAEDELLSASLRSVKDLFNEKACAIEDGNALFTQADPYEINVMTNYCVHSSAPATTKALRTFVRVIYTTPGYNDLENLPLETKQALGLKMF